MLWLQGFCHAYNLLKYEASCRMRGEENIFLLPHKRTGRRYPELKRVSPKGANRAALTGQ